MSQAIYGEIGCDLEKVGLQEADDPGALEIQQLDVSLLGDFPRLLVVMQLCTKEAHQGPVVLMEKAPNDLGPLFLIRRRQIDRSRSGPSRSRPLYGGVLRICGVDEGSSQIGTLGLGRCNGKTSGRHEVSNAGGSLSCASGKSR